MQLLTVIGKGHSTIAEILSGSGWHLQMIQYGLTIKLWFCKLNTYYAWQKTDDLVGTEAQHEGIGDGLQEYGCKSEFHKRKCDKFSQKGL